MISWPRPQDDLGSRLRYLFCSGRHSLCYDFHCNAPPNRFEPPCSTTVRNASKPHRVLHRVLTHFQKHACELPSSYKPLTIKRTAFTNKAFENVQVNTENVLISLAKNSFSINEVKSSTSVEEFSVTIVENDTKVISVEKATDKVTIADADTVVSAGRGLKGPENWGMIEELAEVLGAATACSKPVSDLGWRPHGEHVGQTGKPVATNLYIAIGISGAIQHLAGINSSKVKVVINTDPDAPFFKAADYGVVGDAFEVVPELINKLKTFKAQN